MLPGRLSILALLVMLPIPGNSQKGVRSSSPLPVPTVSGPVTVDLTTAKWLEDYRGWIHLHSLPVKGDASVSIPPPVTLGMPYLELFSAGGIPIYRGSNAAQNSSFLHDLEREVPSRSLIQKEESRPTLREYINMVSALKPYESQILHGKQYTIFAVTFPDKPFCKAQNDAIRQFYYNPNIRVIEIRLHA